MNCGCTATVRFFDASNQYEPAIEWMLPSNTSPTTSPRAFTIGLPELPPMMSVVATKLARRVRSSCGCASSHAVGSANGGAPVCRPYSRSSCVNGGTVGQSQRERGVGVNARPVRLEPGLRDCLLRAAHGTVHFRFVNLPKAPRLLVDGAGEEDHRIPAGGDRRLAALEETHANARVAESRFLHQLACALVRAGRPKHCSDHRMIGAEVLAHSLEGKGQSHLFEFRVHRSLRLELCTHLRQSGVRKLAEPAGVRLGTLVGGADERARIPE